MRILLTMGQYAKNAAAVFTLNYHLVWSRLGCTGGPALQALLQQKTAELGISMHSLQIRPDHVHLFVQADPTRCVAEMVHRWKRCTSHVLRMEFASLRSRWPTLGRRSYYSCSSVSRAVVRKYGEAQKKK